MFLGKLGALPSQKLVATKTRQHRGWPGARSSTDIVYPSLGIGVGRSTRYARAWPIFTGRISPATLTTPSCKLPFARRSSPPCEKPRTRARTRPAPLRRAGGSQLPHVSVLADDFARLRCADCPSSVSCPPDAVLSPALRTGLGSRFTGRQAGIVYLLDIEPTDPVVELVCEARESSV